MWALKRFLFRNAQTGEQRRLIANKFVVSKCGSVKAAVQTPRRVQHHSMPVHYTRSFRHISDVTSASATLLLLLLRSDWLLTILVTCLDQPSASAHLIARHLVFSILAHWCERNGRISVRKIIWKPWCKKFFIPITFFTFVNVFFHFVDVFYFRTHVHWKFHQEVREALLKPQKQINRSRFYYESGCCWAALHPLRTEHYVRQCL